MACVSHIPCYGGWCERGWGGGDSGSLQYRLSLLCEKRWLRHDPLLAQLLVMFETLCIADRKDENDSHRRWDMTWCAREKLQYTYVQEWVYVTSTHQVIPSRQYQLFFSVSCLSVQLECSLNGGTCMQSHTHMHARAHTHTHTHTHTHLQFLNLSVSLLNLQSQLLHLSTVDCCISTLLTKSFNNLNGDNTSTHIQ